MNSITNRRISDAKKEIIFSEFASLISSGLDFSRAFILLIDGEQSKKTKKLLRRIYECVVSGMLLWQAMQKSGEFTNLDSGVVHIGEETGRLSEVLNFLSTYYRNKIQQKRIVMSAIRYPIIVLCTALIVVVFMLSVIVPMFEQVYLRMGGELPGLTKWIISVSKSFPTYAIIIGTIIIAVTGLLYYYRNRKSVRAFMASITLHTPILSGITKRTNQMHFCKLLNLVIESGVPLLNGIDMLKGVITLYPYQQSFDTMSIGVRHGELLSTNMAKFPKLYNNKLIAMVRVGEETNKMPAMFARQGDELTKELEFNLQKIGALLEPSLIIFVGILVAVILISMYMPMFKLGGIIG
jgi:type IV pilus assembly protein PilC